MNLAIAIKKGQSPLNSSAIPSLVCFPFSVPFIHCLLFENSGIRMTNLLKIQRLRGFVDKGERVQKLQNTADASADVLNGRPLTKECL